MISFSILPAFIIKDGEESFGLRSEVETEAVEVAKHYVSKNGVDKPFSSFRDIVGGLVDKIKSGEKKPAPIEKIVLN